MNRGSFYGRKRHPRVKKDRFTLSIGKKARQPFFLSSQDKGRGGRGPAFKKRVEKEGGRGDDISQKGVKRVDIDKKKKEQEAHKVLKHEGKGGKCTATRFPIST